MRRISFESFEYTNEVLTTFLDISSTTIKTALKDGRAKMHPPSSLTSCFDYEAMSLSLFLSLRGNRRQFLVEKILSQEEECFDPKKGSFGKEESFLFGEQASRAFRRKGPEASE